MQAFINSFIALQLISILAHAAEPPGSVSAKAGIDALGNALGATLDGLDDRVLARIAVMPLDALDTDSKSLELGRVASELISARLADRPRLLQVERARIDAVFAELARSKNAQLDPGGAASVGKLLGANAIVVGSVAAAGADFVITARAVDAETGAIITAADSTFARAGMVALSEEMVEVKSRAGAALRSAALPGWGQIYNGDSGRGVVYGAAFSIAAAGAIVSAILGNTAKGEYQQGAARHVGRRHDANGHYERANLSLLGMGAIWAVSIADAWWTGADARTIRAAPTGDHAGLGATFRF